MITVHKYPLMLTDRGAFMLPRGSKLLHLGVQHEEICAWFLVDTTEPGVSYEYAVYGTGHPVATATGEHMGTVQLGPYVWHVFKLER